MRTALENAVGKDEVKISETEGHHGNPITILESSSEDMEVIADFFSKLRATDINELIGSLSSRIDDGCNLFIRIDKQAAYAEDIKLARNDDIISVRIKVRSYPARSEIATSIAKEYLEDLRSISGRNRSVAETP